MEKCIKQIDSTIDSYNMNICTVASVWEIEQSGAPVHHSASPVLEIIIRRPRELSSLFYKPCTSHPATSLHFLSVIIVLHVPEVTHFLVITLVFLPTQFPFVFL